jgi:hypothetical protein
MSSSAGKEVDTCCADANCGIAEVDEDEVKMEECAGKLLRSCSDKSREEHQEQHKCKKRMEELHDKELFTQPDGSHLGECPLCFLPMPLGPRKSTFYSCCSKLICNGCVCSNIISNKYDKVKALSCPFCREPAAASVEENKKRMMKRIKANDPAALNYVGVRRYHEGDYNTAFGYYSKAAELGSEDAQFNLSVMYRYGYGVEKDEEKEVYRLEKAAIGGHYLARHELGRIENENGNIERAVKHFVVAATHGYERSMKELWTYYSAGSITKDDLEATLRTHKAALDEMKSLQRDEAEHYWKIGILDLRKII